MSVSAVGCLGVALGARRPLLVKGEPGVGKTQLAEAVATALGRLLLSVTVDSRTESRDLLYSFDAVRRLAEAQLQGAIPTQDSAERSSFLTGADITRLNLRGTELVVFSACDTGNGEVVAGEGVVSLRRSVEEAGARSSVTSLWPVPSASTARLMVDFYENLGSGLGKAQALRQAKLSMLKSSPDPVHWAGFLLAGEP